MDVAASLSLLERAQLVSWDMDGTLYDKSRVRRAVQRRVVLQPWRALDAVRLARLYRQAEARRGRGGLDVAARHLRRRLEAQYLVPALTHVGPAPGVTELLRAITARGLQQVVVSDYPAEAKLLALGLVPAFARTYDAEAMGMQKPAVEPLLAAARDFGVEPRAVVHIGDRDDADGAMARAAGASYIAAEAIPALAAALSSDSSSQVTR